MRESPQITSTSKMKQSAELNLQNKNERMRKLRAIAIQNLGELLFFSCRALQ